MCCIEPFRFTRDISSQCAMRHSMSAYWPIKRWPNPPNTEGSMRAKSIAFASMRNFVTQIVHKVKYTASIQRPMVSTVYFEWKLEPPIHITSGFFHFDIFLVCSLFHSISKISEIRSSTFGPSPHRIRTLARCFATETNSKLSGRAVFITTTAPILFLT